MQITFLINNGHVNAFEYGFSWFERIVKTQLKMLTPREEIK